MDSKGAATDQATNLHNQCVQLLKQVRDARRRGSDRLAEKRLRQAFESERRAADLLAPAYEERDQAAQVHRSAARLALKCGEVREAERLCLAGLGVSSDAAREEFFQLLNKAEALWQRTTGATLGEVVFTVPLRGVRVAFSPDSQYIVCAGEMGHGKTGPAGLGNIAYVYSMAQKGVESSFELEFKLETRDYGFGINDLCFSPDGKSLALASDDGLVLVWDWDTRKKCHLLLGHNHKTRSVAFSPDGRLLASSGWDFRVKLWNPCTGKKLASFKARRQLVDSAVFSPDGKRLAWGCEGGYVTVLEVESRRELYSFRPHKDSVFGVAFSPCGTKLASTSMDGTVKLLDAASGRELATFHGGHFSLAFAPGGRLLASAWNNEVLIWDVDKMKCVCAVRGPASYLRFSPDGETLVASGHAVRFWNVARLLKTQRELSHLTGMIGKTVLPVDPQPASNWIAPVARPGPGPSKMRAPDHLAGCTIPVMSQCTGKKYTAHLQCACGRREFHIFHTDATYLDDHGARRLQVAHTDIGFFLVVKAVCLECQAPHLLFDMDFHGWNGFVCRSDDHLRKRPELVSWKCATCSGLSHCATVCVSGPGKTDALGESGGQLDESNWQEGFGCIEVALKCCECGHKVRQWLAHEAM